MVLVANRGEIALRVVRACRESGVRVAVAHSTVDAGSAAVRQADAAVCIGPGPAKLSYLNVPAVIEAARRVGADAVHPGYGFLSESADFAEVCAAEGLRFIGPPPEVMQLLGDKASCRSAMAAAGLPLLPGSLDPVDSVQDARRVADAAGWPVVVKAVAGGGGRGIHVAAGPEQLDATWARTRADARALFGDPRVYVERFLPAPRHVEVQVLADGHGSVVALGERDCTVQRRHQKLVEEAPAPALPREVAEAMSRDAVRGAEAAGYVGAGTFEFLLDTDLRHYFMEVNCRVQVEHPVTEMMTGVDIVREQLAIAAGERLSVTADAARPRGCAIECRLNAEDPGRDFAPTPGRIEEFVMPGGPFVRVDSHLGPGTVVPPFYDSLLAKLVVWGPDRATAVARMRRALEEVRVTGPGVRTTAEFLLAVLDEPDFVGARHDTGLVEAMLRPRPTGPGGDRP